MWSLGVIIYELMTTKLPFIGFSEQDIYIKLNEDSLLFPKETPINLPLFLFIKRCFTFEPHLRITSG